MEAYEGDYKEYLELVVGELEDEYRTQALRNMPTGDLRKCIHLQFPGGNYESLRQQVHRYAMLQIKDSRTASSTVAGVSNGDHEGLDSGAQHANAIGQGFDHNSGYGWVFHYDDSQAMDSERSLDALGKGNGFGKKNGKPNTGQGKGKPGMANCSGCHNC